MGVIAAPRMADGVNRIPERLDKISPDVNPWGDDLLIGRLQMKSKSRGPGGNLPARHGRASYELHGRPEGHWAGSSFDNAVKEAQLRSAASRTTVAVLQADNGAHFLTPVLTSIGKHHDGTPKLRRVDGLEGYRWVAVSDTIDAVKALVWSNHTIDLTAKPPAK